MPTERKGMLFREYPLITTLLYMRQPTEAMRLALLLELLRDELRYNVTFGIKEVGH